MLSVLVSSPRVSSELTAHCLTLQCAEEWELRRVKECVSGVKECMRSVQECMRSVLTSLLCTPLLYTTAVLRSLLKSLHVSGHNEQYNTNWHMQCGQY